jgi:hypothetical protein
MSIPFASMETFESNTPACALRKTTGEEVSLCVLCELCGKDSRYDVGTAARSLPDPPVRHSLVEREA